MFTSMWVSGYGFGKGGVGIVLAITSFEGFRFFAPFSEIVKSGTEGGGATRV